MTYLQSPSGEVFQSDYPNNHKDCTKLTNAAGKLARRDYARAELRKILKPGQVVYTILRHRSASGMSRRISLVTVVDGSIRDINNLSADAAGFTISKNDGSIVVGGCGMDMGFHLVYNLGSALWPEGTPKPHGTRNGAPDSAGGYALKHQWL